MSRSITILMSALQAGATADAWFEALGARDEDQDDLVITALALGLAPLLHHRLAQWGAVLTHPRAQAKLDFARRAEEARHSALLAQLGGVLRALPCTPIVLKGAYLAEHVYPAPGLRPMNDIDLLMRPEDLPAADEALRGLGYVPKDTDPNLGPGITKHTRTYRRAGSPDPTPNPYLSGGGDRMIEPHRSLEESWFGLRCDLTPGVWDRSREARCAGHPARALRAEDMLLHQCVHLAFHLIMGAPSFVQLADLGVLLGRAAVEWGDFVGRAQGLRAGGYAYAALGLAQRVLAVAVPEEVMRDLKATSPRGLVGVAERLTLAEVLRRTQQPPLRTIPQRLRRGWSDRRETARWAHSAGEWLRVWWSLVDFTRTDTWRMMRARAAR